MKNPQDVGINNVYLYFQMDHAMLHHNEYLDQFGISINSHMRKVEGRVLDPPPIQYQV
jgi:hypothetical protein